MTEYINARMESLIDELIHSDIDRIILKRRLIDGWTYRQIAELVEMDESTCKRRVYKSQARLFNEINPDV